MLRPPIKTNWTLTRLDTIIVEIIRDWRTRVSAITQCDMADANYQGLHEYYKARDFKPTFAKFSTDSELDRYEKMRRILFRDLLHLPRRIFDGARVCEFGPDTGENALAFARWGARVTLVEPNSAAWPDIRSYFRQYRLEPQLEAIVGETVETFQSDSDFDVINAEGFIYTVQPAELWLAKFARLLAPNGFAVVNYLDRTGCLFELLWSLCYARYRQLSKEVGVAAAWSLFEPKWNSIAHTRPFESWVKDVLENPFVRLKYLIDPVDLSSSAFAQKLGLHASWPRYENPFYPYWHKHVPNEATLEARRRAFISRSRLSFAFARPLFIVASDIRVATINLAVLQLVTAIDNLIDNWDGAILKRTKVAVSELDDAVAGFDMMAEADVRSYARAILATLARTLDLLEIGNPVDIRNHLRGDEILISTWGATTHYAVFRHLD
jgi:predicted O-methyltransferase YrrM